LRREFLDRYQRQPAVAAGFGSAFRNGLFLRQLVVSLYLAAVVVFQIAIGHLSDRFGRRPVMLACLGV
jgi:MFS family permease